MLIDMNLSKVEHEVHSAAGYLMARPDFDLCRWIDETAHDLECARASRSRGTSKSYSLKADSRKVAKALLAMFG